MSVATVPILRTFDRCLLHWLVRKYGFDGIDQQGLSIFQIHPRLWDEGDYDFVLRWNEFRNSEAQRPLYVMKLYVEEARERGINTMPVDPFFPLERKPMGAWAKVLIGLGAVGGAWWLLKPSKFDHLEGVPDIDTKPAEDLLIDVAKRNLPRKRAQTSTTTMTTYLEEEENDRE